MKRKPKRRCAGCMQSFDKDTLIRIVLKPGRFKIIDIKQAEEGRGTYICRSMECLNKSIKKKSFERAFKCPVEKDFYDRLEREILKHGVSDLE